MRYLHLHAHQPKHSNAVFDEPKLEETIQQTATLRGNISCLFYLESRNCT